MNTPETYLETSAAVELQPQLAMDGTLLMVVMIKERFGIQPGESGVGRLGDAEIRFADVPWDETNAAYSSIKLPADACIRKPSTDVFVKGDAVAPGGVPVKELLVHVEVGPVSRTLRVHGTRVWYRPLSAMRPSAALPFERVPLKWELAFGGHDESDPARPIEESRNPVGTGIARDLDSLRDRLAPQIEDPREPITNPKSRPAPAGVGPLGRHWEPRRRYVGTQDAQWMKERMPLPPLDFDDRYNQAAPPELITAAPLSGGETVRITGMALKGDFHFVLPRLHFGVGVWVDGVRTEQRPLLDTVFLQPSDDEPTVELTWRTAVTVPRPSRRLELVEVIEKEVR